MALAELGSLSAVPDPASPEGWRDRLLKALDQRAAEVAVLERYYDGDHPLPQLPDRMQNVAEARRAFETLSQLGVTNFMKPVADAPAQRLRPSGVLAGSGAEAEETPEARAIWQRNHLDADVPLSMHKALVAGNSLLLVWPVKGLAEITVEHPSQAIVAYAPGSRRRRVAGLKCWTEDDNTARVVLYLPESVYKWRSKGQATEGLPVAWEQWQPPTDDTWPIKNPLGEVPLVELRANPDTRPSPFGGGRGEFVGVLTIQNRINKTVFDRLVTAEFQAFRQRWAIGWTPDNPNQAVQAAVSNLMSFEDENVKVGEFGQADFTGFLAAVSKDVEAIAAITATPMYALGQLANPPSGDALIALQSGLIQNAIAHRNNFGATLNETLDLAVFAETGRRVDVQVQWESVTLVTLAEISAAAVQMKSVGVPDEALWLMFPDVTSDIVERWKVMQADKDLFAPDAGQ